MKIYHYASLDYWPGIKHGSWKSQDTPGLAPYSRVCMNSREDEVEESAAREAAVFGLLEPEPAAWRDSVDFPNIWASLMRNTGRLLLSYEANDEVLEKSYIIDWSHMEKMLGGHRDHLRKESDPPIAHGDKVSAEKLYWASRIPLLDYARDPKVIEGIVLPEVITMCHVPFESIEVAEVQPKLSDITPHLQEDIEVMIGRNPELEVLSAYLPAA